ncbi:MAG: hypothetical protein DMG67_13290, partial [Acidobacteria bacterium]
MLKPKIQHGLRITVEAQRRGGMKLPSKFRVPRVLFLPLLLLLSSVLPAHARSWNISDYSSSILIEENGTSLVTERITCVFVGEYHGIYRRIPIEYPGPNGSHYTLFLDVLKAEDENGSELETKTS